MDRFSKFFALTALIVGSFVGFVLLVTALFFLLKFFSITMFKIPGAENAFHFFIVLVPYSVFFAAYYYLHKKTSYSTKKGPKVFSRILLLTGSLTCIAALCFAMLIFFNVKSNWVTVFNQNSQWVLFLQVVILTVAAAILATGDAKEKDWMERAAERE